MTIVIVPKPSKSPDEYAKNLGLHLKSHEGWTDFYFLLKRANKLSYSLSLFRVAQVSSY